VGVGQSLAPATVVAGHSTTPATAIAYCLTTPGAAAAAAAVGGASPYECVVPAAAFNVPWTIAVINPVVLVTNLSEQVGEDQSFQFSLRPWLQLRFDCNSTTKQLLYVTAYLFWAAALRSK